MLISIQCSRLQPQSPPWYGSRTGSMPFPQVLAGARWILGGWWWSGWLWCCGWSCWWCSRHMTKGSSLVGSGRAGGSERRVQSRSTPSEAKPGSLWTCGPALIPAATHRVCHLIAPEDHHTLQHIQVHFSVDFQADFKDVRRHDEALTWNHTKDHSHSQKLCFHHPGHVELSGFAFWGCWQWSCCHNLDW